MRLTMRQSFKLVSLLIGVIGILILFSLHRASLYNGLVALDVIPEPDKLTEIYFNDHTHLPKSATSNEVIRFSFVIHNLETTDYQYAYQVSVNAHGMRLVVDSGTVLVKNDQYYVKYEQFSLLNSPGSQEVVVELISKRQSIHFRTTGE